jgi:hypothetical protein
MVQNSTSSAASPYSRDTFILYEYCFFLNTTFKYCHYQTDVVKTVKIHIINKFFRNNVLYNVALTLDQTYVLYCTVLYKQLF